VWKNKKNHVQLPIETKARKEFSNGVAKQAKAQGFTLRKDSGQEHLFVMLD